jgi:origin recognition complex subunit 2
LLVACRERFLVSSESVLKSQLGEFRDHQLVTSKRMPDGAELLVINLSSDVMTELLASWPE